MKFGYEGEDDSILVSNYKKLDGKIIIRFLDGSEKEIELTDSNEKVLLNEMLNQAIRRDNITSVSELKKVKNKYLSLFFMQLVLIYLNSYIYANANDASTKMVSFIFASISGIFAGIDGKGFTVSRKMIEELQKYNVFLDLRHELEEYKNISEIYKGIKLVSDEININTLDFYSLGDLKKLKKNLINLKSNKTI